MGWRNRSGTTWLALLALACGATSRNGNDGAAGGADLATAGTAPAETAVGAGANEGGARTVGVGGSSSAPGPSAPTAAAGAGASAGMDHSSGGDITGAGAAGAAGASGGACPIWPVKAASPPAEVTFNGVTIKGSERDCAWTLGKSVKLPDTATHTRMLFHYDVNGDGIDDVFAGPNRDNFPDPLDGTVHGTITLLLSKVANGVLSFEPTDCALAPPLVDGKYALRDLDGDGVPDFVIAVSNGFRVVMNRPSGPEVTIAYDFPADDFSQVTMADVVLGAFGKDSTSELAVGFVRIANHYATTQSGTLLFRDPSHASAQAPVPLAISDQKGNGLDYSLNPQLGIFTVLPGGRALFGVSAFDAWTYENGKLTTTVNGIDLGGGYVVSGATYLGTITLGGRDLVFANLGDVSYAFDLQDAKHYVKIPGAFPYAVVNGIPSSSQLLDVDGDGDLDLMDSQLATTPSLGIHNGDLSSGPIEQAHVFTPDRYRAPASDTPFLAIGAAKGRLLVSDADRTNVLGSPLSVSAVRCGP